MNPEFDEDKRIDPEALDVEAAQQAELFFKWAEQAVQAKGEVDRAKLELDLLEARLAFRVRSTPKEYGLGRVTDPAVVQTVRTLPRYIEAYRTWIKARETSALLEKATEAMEQKKRMIEVLITLHGQEYFAGPSVPRNLVSAWKDHTAKRQERSNQRQRDVAREKKS